MTSRTSTAVRRKLSRDPSELRASAYKIAAAVFGVLAVALLIRCMFLWNRATRADVRADAESARAESERGKELRR